MRSAHEKYPQMYHKHVATTREEGTAIGKIHGWKCMVTFISAIMKADR